MQQFLKDARRMLPGLVVSIILLAVILYFVDLRMTLAAIKAANFGLLLLVLILGVFWLLVRGLVWRVLIRGRASYRDVFLTLMEGYLLNNFLPFRLGEIGRAAQARRAILVEHGRVKGAHDAVAEVDGSARRFFHHHHRGIAGCRAHGVGNGDLVHTGLGSGQ